MSVVGIILVLLGSLLSLVAFVCAIIVVVKMFQENQTGLGVATVVGLFICGFGYILALVYGWKNKVAWKLETIMPIFTGSLVLSFVLFVPGYVMLVASMAGDIQTQMRMQQNQMQMQMDQNPMPDIEMPQIEMPQPAPQQ
jgi:peptidoglycan/LPS O-acetylase OafA/YrhL